jgi:DNA-binding NarL/FixJ family response regulator
MRDAGGTEPIPIAVANGDWMARDGLRGELEREGAYRVIIAAANGRELTEGILGGEAPSVAIVHLCMPVMDGYAVLDWMRANRPQVRVLAYGEAMDADTVVRCYRSQAHGLLVRGGPVDELRTALRTALGGGIYHTALSQQLLLENADGLTPEERRCERIRAQLTPAQQKVLTHLCRADDPTYAHIAEDLGISPRTVERHVADLREVFGVPSKTALVMAAARLGIVKL